MNEREDSPNDLNMLRDDLSTEEMFYPSDEDEDLPSEFDFSSEEEEEEEEGGPLVLLFSDDLSSDDELMDGAETDSIGRRTRSTFSAPPLSDADSDEEIVDAVFLKMGADDPRTIQYFKQKEEKRRARQLQRQEEAKRRRATSKGRASPRTQVPAVNPRFSDGDENTFPPLSSTMVDAELGDDNPAKRVWLPKLGLMETGFPSGYHLFGQMRATATNRVLDFYLYGHPSGKRYRSPAEFVPHLQWLVTGDPALPCSCQFCKNERLSPARVDALLSTSKQSTPSESPPSTPTRVRQREKSKTRSISRSKARGMKENIPDNGDKTDAKNRSEEDRYSSESSEGAPLRPHLMGSWLLPNEHAGKDAGPRTTPEPGVKLVNGTFRKGNDIADASRAKSVHEVSLTKQVLSGLSENDGEPGKYLRPKPDAPSPKQNARIDSPVRAGQDTEILDPIDNDNLASGKRKALGRIEEASRKVARVHIIHTAASSLTSKENSDDETKIYQYNKTELRYNTIYERNGGEDTVSELSTEYSDEEELSEVEPCPYDPRCGEITWCSSEYLDVPPGPNGERPPKWPCVVVHERVVALAFPTIFKRNGKRRRRSATPERGVWVLPLAVPALWKVLDGNGPRLEGNHVPPTIYNPSWIELETDEHGHLWTNGSMHPFLSRPFSKLPVHSNLHEKGNVPFTQALVQAAAICSTYEGYDEEAVLFGETIVSEMETTRPIARWDPLPQSAHGSHDGKTVYKTDFIPLWAARAGPHIVLPNDLIRVSHRSKPSALADFFFTVGQLVLEVTPSNKRRIWVLGRPFVNPEEGYEQRLPNKVFRFRIEHVVGRFLPEYLQVERIKIVREERSAWEGWVDGRDVIRMPGSA